jgi:hypothetical protein
MGVLLGLAYMTLIAPFLLLISILLYVTALGSYIFGEVSHQVARRSEFWTFRLTVLLGVVSLMIHFVYWGWGFTVVNLIVYLIYRIHIIRMVKQGAAQVIT